MNIVILGLSITSSWGNGHATTYRGLTRELCALGHDVLFLERDTPWYSKNRDVDHFSPVRVELYGSVQELDERFRETIQRADVVMIGSYVPEGIAVGEWVLAHAEGITAFYDIDTPVTLASLKQDRCTYLTTAQIATYRLYLSFTGGPTLTRLEQEFGSPMARPLYCSVDPSAYFPQAIDRRWDLGYLGTYSADRQPTLERLLIQAAAHWEQGRFIVAGPMYPESVIWPENVTRIDHLAPGEHGRFYNEQRFTLNVTRSDMIAAGYSPSVRLFEAAACGVPIISDYWPGLETFFTPGAEIIVAESTEHMIETLQVMTLADSAAIGNAARQRVLREHSAAHRAGELLFYLHEIISAQPQRRQPVLSS
jgi:spore maturation protein CgeB